VRKNPAAVDVDSTLILGKPELRVLIDRERAADLGVRVTDVADTLRLFVAGMKASNYAEGGEQYDVQVRADAQWRVDPETLAMVDVPSSKQGTVPLTSVVTFSKADGPSVIDRLGRQRQVTIGANAAPGHGESEVNAAIQAAAKDAGATISPIGRTKESGRAAAGFRMVFGLSFVFMYLVLAAQFESWIHPLTILVTLPLTVPFALLSLLIFGQSLNIFSMLGLLVLFGVVKKNAILQIDQTNQLRARGMPRLEAILEANRERLRPILMTTLAFVAGMVPLMTSKGIGAEKNQAMAGIVLGGQSLSLLLTLLAAPVLYSLLDDAAAWVSRKRKGAEVDRGEAELDALLGVEQPEPAE
jgi:multidrug efflux pump subunit AcrB